MTKTNKNRLVLLLGYVVLITGCLCVLLPLSWMVITSLKSMTDITLSKGLKLFPSGPTLENFANIWKEYPIATYIKNSIIAVGGSTIFGVICAALCGYGLSRYEFRGKALLLSFLLVTQMFPAVMKIIPYYKILVSLHLNNTRTGLLVVYASFGIPFCTWMMYGYFRSIPTGLDEAAGWTEAAPSTPFIKSSCPLPFQDWWQRSSMRFSRTGTSICLHLSSCRRMRKKPSPTQSAPWRMRIRFSGII